MTVLVPMTAAVFGPYLRAAVSNYARDSLGYRVTGIDMPENLDADSAR